MSLERNMECKALDIIKAAKDAGYSFIESNGETGDARLVLWRVGPVLAIETNGASVWEDSEEFDALLEQVRAHAV